MAIRCLSGGLLMTSPFLPFGILWSLLSMRTTVESQKQKAMGCLSGGVLDG